MSHLPFACNRQNRFLESEPIVTHFSSNKGWNSGIRIPHDFAELYPTPCMRVVYRVCGFDLSCTSKQNVLSFILLISLVELTNQKRGIYRHCILYPLRLESSFPSDVKILKPKVGLGPNRIEIDLRKCFLEKYNFFWTT